MPLEDSPFEFRDWAYLPPEVVELISEKVKSINDYVRFCAVCSPWRSASLQKLPHLPLQLPWLMLPFEPCPDEKDDGIRLLYDMWESKMRMLYLPETIGVMCFASYRGWLLLVSIKGREVFLLNPLTRAQIHLPPFTAPVKRLGNKLDRLRFDATYMFDSYMGFFAKSKMTFSADIANPNCLITVCLWQTWVLCCRVGDCCWTRVISRHDGAPSDAIYYNGQFYLLYKGAMDIIKSNKPEEVINFIFEPDLRAVRMRLLEGKSGVYVVAFHSDQNIKIYKFQEQSLKLEVTCTSNTIIFGGSITGPYLVVCSDDWDSLDGDSIYIEYSCIYRVDEHYLGSVHSIFGTDRDGDTIEHIVRDPGKKRRFWPPEPAMWFQPSFF
ncbi:hypothetical protein LUZ61_017007 [Rhynchospora tenuis]|uniref:F-box domain-containing protein n=1 Tax=Rhynchospora tenuis TaxID=198213 RepID=A0AAD6EKM9_9POAL|nr:hypothetical protein LUZ61_017007 [Rhynchospora tenuis]